VTVGGGEVGLYKLRKNCKQVVGSSEKLEDRNYELGMRMGYTWRYMETLSNQGMFDEARLTSLLHKIKEAGGDPFSNPDYQSWRREEEAKVVGDDDAISELNRCEARLLAQGGFVAEAKALFGVVGRGRGSEAARRSTDLEQEEVEAFANIRRHIRQLEQE